MVCFAATGFFAAGGVEGWAMGGLEKNMSAYATVCCEVREHTVMVVWIVCCK